LPCRPLQNGGRPIKIERKETQRASWWYNDFGKRSYKPNAVKTHGGAFPPGDHKQSLKYTKNPGK